MVSVAVYENESDVTDADGRPPHSVECVVLGGVDADIASAIWRNKSTGAQTFGTTAVNITDSQGQPRVVRFNRPSTVTVWLDIDVRVLPGYPSDGDAQIAAHLESWAAGAMQVGADVVLSRISAEVFRAVHTGLDDVVAVRVGTANPPLGITNLPISPRQLAQIAQARTAVHHV